MKRFRNRGSVPPAVPEAATPGEVLRRRALRQAGQRAYTYLPDGESEEVHLSYEELDRCARAVAVRLRELGATGQRVLLLHPPGLDYAVAVWGCLYAGAVAVLAFPPRLNRPTPRLSAIMADAQPMVALSHREVLSKLGRHFRHTPELAALKWLATDDLPAGTEDEWQAPEVDGDTLAFLQYTSGSTGTPKGVMLTHGNVVHNLSLIAQGFEIGEDDQGVIWLPIYHDMGLVGGVLTPVFTGIPVTLMPPAAFLQRPVRWLENVTRYRGSISGGPNFAYQLCVEKVTPEQRAGLDLSRWRVAFCGAEPIHPQTLERFAETFAPCGFRREAFYPCYGMAETTLIVSGGLAPAAPVLHRIDREALEQGRAADAAAPDAPDARTLVGCGQALRDLEVVVADPETRTRRPPGQVGEIWVSGKSVAQGYWNRPQESEETFRAYLVNGGHANGGRSPEEGPFLRTGDLGYLRAGELFVTGRLKDLIVIRGHNHYPQDVERTVEQSHPALRSGGGGAFSVEVDGEERLVVVHEVERHERQLAVGEVISAIRSALAEHHDLAVHAVALIKTLSLPKTSSGKVQRHVCRARFLAGELKVVGEWRQDRDPLPAEPGSEERPQGREAPAAPSPAAPSSPAIRSWLVTQLSERLRVPAREIDVHAPFARYGLDSAQAMGLAGDLELWLGRRLAPTLAYEYPTVEALARHLAAEDVAEEVSTPGPGGGRGRETEDEPVAVVGIGCRWPGAAGPEAFWRLLRDGVDAVTEVPPERWDLAAFFDPDPEAPGKISTRWGGFLEGVDQFDPQFFGLSHREAARMDPQQRLLLETAWEALEDAGQVPEQLAGSRTGVFVGISTYDYSRLQMSDPRQIDAFGGTGNALSIAANRLSYVFDFQGPSLAVDTACSSSLVAVHLARLSLSRGECGLALAAGVNLVLSPAVTMTFTKARALAADGRCKSFDARADGFVRSEGAGCVVLKPLRRALADGDPVYAVIRGSAVNQDGRTNGLMAPSRQAQEAVLRQACASAGVSPGRVRYVEAHGTGTLLGDPIEAKALGAVLADGRPAGDRCAVGSVKSNLGHTEAAAGIAGLIKVALSLRHGRIPPSLHFEEPNPHIPFDALPLTVQRELGRWPRGSGPALAGVSSFGFGGTNAHVIVEQAPFVEEAPREEPAGDLPYLLPLSAHTPEALVARARSWLGFLGPDGDGADLPVADVGYTASLRRGHLDHRLGLVCRSRGELLEGLKAFAGGESRPGLSVGRRVAGERPELVFVFSGQGPQWWAMGRELAAREEVFRSVLEECDQRLRTRASWSLLAELGADEARSRLEDTEVAQPVLFALQTALAALWRHWGVEPDAVVGHSAGEVAAAHLAGVLSLDEALWVAYERGRFMQRVAGRGKMAAVALDVAAAESVLADHGGRLSVAAVNSPTSTVLSGEPEALESVLESLGQKEVFCRRLRGSTAFHSPQMEPLEDGFEQALEGLGPRPATLPLVSTLSGRLRRGDEWDASYWRRQMRQPVRFAAAVETLLEMGVRNFLEIGPHPVLGAAISECLRHGGHQGGVFASLRRDQGERASMLATLGALHAQGQPVDWRRLYPEGGRCVALPSYPWQRERCWIEPGDGAAGPGWDQGAGRRAGENGHPLLGRRLPLAHLREDDVWESELSPRWPSYLEDHRVDDSVVLPGAAYLEMALAAVAQTSGPAPRALTQVRFRSPLLLPDEGRRRVQVVLAREGRDEVSFRVFSRPSDAGEDAAAWTPHATGRIADAAPEDGTGGPRSLDLEEIRGRCRQEVAAEDYYRQLLDRGLRYGSAFRGITKLWRCHGEALGWVEAPPAVTSETAPYQIHPALLDACGQVLVATDGGGNGDGNGHGRLFLPAGLDELRIYAPPGPRTWSHARLRSADPAADTLVGDARLLDEEGRVLVEARGLRLQLLGGDAQRLGPRSPNEWLHEIRWEVAEPPGAPAPAERGTWLLFQDAGGVARSLAGWLEDDGSRPVLVSPGAAYASSGGDRFTIRPGEPDDMRRLLDEAVPEGCPPLRGVVHLWGLWDARPEEVTVASLEAAEVRGCRTVIHVVQELARREWDEPPRLYLVTRGAQAVGPADSVTVSQAPLWGLGRTVAQEQPNLWGGLIDLDPTSPAGDEGALLHRHLGDSRGENQLCWRGDQAYVARLVPRPWLSTRAAAFRCRPDGTYLVTGGLGELGFQVSRWLVSQGARRLILLGRTRLPPRSEWSGVDPESRLARQVAAVRELESLGASVHLATADVSSEEEVAAFLATFRREGWPAVRGVVHAAGVLQDQTLLRLTAEATSAVFRAKVLGGWLVHRLLEESPLDFFVLFSSVASILGSAGQANYAAANAFLDALAHARRSRGLPALAVNWGPWAEGLAAERGERLAQRGIGNVRPDQGFEILERLLRQDAPQVGVLPVHWGRFFRSFPNFRDSRLLRHVAPAQGEAPEEDEARKARARGAILAAGPGERRQLLEALLARQVAQVVGLSASRLDTRQPLNTMGIDSLLAIDLKNRIEHELGVLVPTVKLLEGPSIAAFAEVLFERLAQASGGDSSTDAPGPEPVPAPGLPPSRSTVIEVRPQGSKPPFFCAHPGALDVRCYGALARGLGEDQPFYVLQPPELDNYRGLEGGLPAGIPLGEVAAASKKALQAVQPRGPYYLGGWSLGGALAFLIAQQLERQGEEVALLALFDSPAPPSGEQPLDYDDAELLAPFARYLGARFGKSLPLYSEDFDGLGLEERFTLIRSTAKEARVIPPDTGLSQIRFLFRVYKNGLLTAIRQLWTCEPEDCPQRITFFRARERLKAFEEIFPDVEMRWGPFASGPLQVHEVPGDHYTMFLRTNARRLAERLTDSLEKAHALRPGGRTPSGRDAPPDSLAALGAE